MSFDDLLRLIEIDRRRECPRLDWSITEYSVSVAFLTGSRCTVDLRWPRLEVR